METENQKSRFLSVIGLILNIIALAILHFFSKMRQSEEILLFTIYLIAMGYFIAIAINNFVINRWKIFKLNAKHFFFLLALLTISCFSVNLEIPVFSQMPDWLIFTFFATYIALGGVLFFPIQNPFYQIISLLFLGIGTIMALYFTLYLMPYIPFAFVGLLFFGLTIHLLMPIILLITILVHVIKMEKILVSKISYAVGIFVPIIILVFFTAQYTSVANKIHQANASIITHENNDLPIWVLLAQNIENNSFTEAILKGDLVYDMGTERNWFAPNIGSFSEAKLHNPFITIAGLLSEKLDISVDERVNILKTLYGNRHAATAKLWTGKDLETAEVLTNIRVYPEYRIAYLEKIISVKNNNQYQWNQQEALYTFTLPEGSVASALSLWINGKEEKSRLSTKAQADSAYKTVVAVEVRDPSVVHWQEGNQLLINVFPCTPVENRRFKIGITIPLLLDSESLVLQNVTFDGPDYNKARETLIIKFDTKVQVSNLEIPDFFKKNDSKFFEYSGNYNENWNIKFDKTQLAKSSFSFGDNSYKVENLHLKKLKFIPENIYLDINSAWSEDEYLEILEIFSQKKVFIYNDEWIEINSENAIEQFKRLKPLNFSFIPLHKLNLKQSLIISKSGESSPNYSDLKESEFIKKVSDFINTNNQKINFYNLGTELSPYLKTLKQFGIFNYNVGTVSDLEELLKKQEILVPDLDSNQVLIAESQMVISKFAKEKASKAPDHLLRLYAYNKIVQEAGKDFFNEQFITNQLISIAEEAYIVSPVSSLIVLETQKDYERFNIDENKNSLGNATTAGHGGVPEPHEWALIILSLVFIAFIYLKKIF
jgi:XrtN system VIT domain protein